MYYNFEFKAIAHTFVLPMPSLTGANLGSHHVFHLLCLSLIVVWLPPNSFCLEGNLAENWPSWIQQFELYHGKRYLRKYPESAHSQHVAEDEVIKVCNTMEFDNYVHDFCKLKGKFRQYCGPRRNMSWTHLFFTRSRGKTELIDAYVTDLKNRTKDCKSEHLTELLIRDCIMRGAAHDQIRGRLFKV